MAAIGKVMRAHRDLLVLQLQNGTRYPLWQACSQASLASTLAATLPCWEKVGVMLAGGLPQALALIELLEGWPCCQTRQATGRVLLIAPGPLPSILDPFHTYLGFALRTRSIH